MTHMDKIDRIDLPASAVLTPSAAADPRYSSAASAEVNLSSLLALDGAVSEQSKADVSNSLLFAQLAANAVYDKFTDPESWARKVLEVLTIVGWSMLKDQTGSPYEVASPVNWPELSKDTFEENYGSRADLVDSTIDASAKLSGASPQAELWNENTYADGKGIYLLGLGEKEADGDPRLGLLLCWFSLNAEAPGILDWQSGVHFSTEFSMLTLNTDVYNQVRKQIIKKLGSRISTDIKFLKLKR